MLREHRGKVHSCEKNAHLRKSRCCLRVNIEIWGAGSFAPWIARSPDERFFSLAPESISSLSRSDTLGFRQVQQASAQGRLCVFALLVLMGMLSILQWTRQLQREGERRARQSSARRPLRTPSVPEKSFSVEKILMEYIFHLARRHTYKQRHREVIRV